MTAHRVEVQVPPARAFAVFAEELGSWWPAKYSWSGEVLEEIGIEPQQGGLCFERGPHGFRCDWGRVLAWEPPDRLVLAWQISPRREPVPDPSKASEVEVSFEGSAGGGTAITLEHRRFERHGDEGAGYEEMLGSPQGWPFLLERYAAEAGSG